MPDLDALAEDLGASIAELRGAAAEAGEVSGAQPEQRRFAPHPEQKV